MKNNGSLLREVRGDMCRLGYLKIMCTVVNEFQPYSKEVLAETLERVVTTKEGKPREWYFPKGLSTTGLIPAATAVNYVELSGKLRIVNTNNYTLDNRGRILRHLLNIENEDRRTTTSSFISHNTLVLEPYERLFFLVALVEEDGLALIPLLEYLTQVKEVSRREAMIYFMENIYEKALTNYLPLVNEEKKYKIKEEIEKAKSFKSIRLSIPKIQDWISTDVYALYRHVGNPRIEWLVDVGFLEKTDSLFKLTSQAPEINKVIKNASTASDLYSELAKVIFPEAKKLSDEKIMELIVDSYNKFSKAGYLSVNMDILTIVVLLEGLRKTNGVASFSKIRDILKSIPEKFPNSARFHYDLQGRPTLIKIDTKTINAR